MKLVTMRDGQGRTSAGLLLLDHDNGIQDAPGGAGSATVLALPYADLLSLLRDEDGLGQARSILADADKNDAQRYSLSTVQLLAPLPEPPGLRDFYAFEQHVKTARSLRGLEIQPEWYEFPTFYFSNCSEIYGPEAAIPYPVGSQALDYELELACVIGREGKNIAAEEADQYIAGYLIMNDWSARDLQRNDMALGLGPGKGKDFATSLGPWLVTPDELASYKHGEPGEERYDLTMQAWINGQLLSSNNFKTVYYSFSRMIAWASHNARLRVGDVFGSGTVGGGCLLELGQQRHSWLRRGDVVEMEITGLGRLRNRIE